MDINETRDKVHDNAVSKGFWDRQPINRGEFLMLIVSEVAEALEADRVGRYADMLHFCDETALRDDDETFKIKFKEHVKDSFEDELADAVIRIMDLAGGLNIDLAEHVRLKMRYNAMREPMHGKKY